MTLETEIRPLMLEAPEARDLQEHPMVGAVLPNPLSPIRLHWR